MWSAACQHLRYAASAGRRYVPPAWPIAAAWLSALRASASTLLPDTMATDPENERIVNSIRHVPCNSLEGE
jgi:hypothetical protein